MIINKLNYKTLLSFYFDISILLFLYVGYIFSLYDISYTVYSVIIYFLAFNVTAKFFFEKESFLSIMFIFNITFFLFLCGRFISYLYFQDFNPFELDFMSYYQPDKSGELKVFLYICFFIVSANFGYFLISASRHHRKDLFFHKSIVFLICAIACFLFFILFFESFALLKKVISEGYLSRYENQAMPAETGEGALRILFFTFCALAIALLKNNKLGLVFLLFLVIYGLLSVLGGERGPFVTIMLMSFWVLFRHKKVSVLKFAIIGSFIFMSMIILLSLSSRGDVVKVDSFINYFFTFIKQQGVTMPIITYAINEIESFPFFAYFSTFEPIAPFRVFSLFMNDEFYKYELGFGSFTAHSLNPDMYANGYGTGFSVVGNFYLFSQGFLFPYIILSFIFGCFIKILSDLSSKSLFWFGATIAVSPALYFVSRAEIKSVIQSFAFYLVVFYFFKLISSILNNQKS